MTIRNDVLAEIFEYLDTLRDSGKTNMFGAGPYVASQFSLNKQESRSALSLWMKTFDANKTPEERAELAQQSK